MKVLSASGFYNLMICHSRFLALFTLRRIANMVKLKISYWFSAFSRRNFHWGMPVAVAIEPTSQCNLQCPECPTGADKLSRSKGKISVDNFKRILEKLPPETMYLNLYFQGEPYLNSQIFEMIQQAKERKMFVTISTNGHFLDSVNTQKTIASDLDEIIISLDASTSDAYVKYRKGGNYERLIQGIQNLTHSKRSMKSGSPLVVLQFLVFSHNEDQLKDAVTLAQSLKADILEFKTAQHYDFEQGNSLMTQLSKHSRYRKTKDGTYVIRNTLRNRCFRMWSSCVITWDGKMVPCCYDKDAIYCYGNLLENGFDRIWNGEKAMTFRQKILTARKEYEICRNCTE